MELWGDRVPVSVQTTYQAHEASILRVNWDKAARLLGWRPVSTWAEALEQTVSWWKEYQRIVQEGDVTDMYDYNVQQITQYSTNARALGIEWACASPGSDGDGLAY
jgi:CDP-glucose 4,6-dehydratase